jgi:hypothetical protein
MKAFKSTLSSGFVYRCVAGYLFAVTFAVVWSRIHPGVRMGPLMLALAAIESVCIGIAWLCSLRRRDALDKK